MSEIKAIEVVAEAIQQYEQAIAICMDKNGNIEVHSTIHYPPDILWAIEQAKNQLFDCGVEYDS